MITRLGYALLAVGLLVLAGTFAVRFVAHQQRALPVVAAPPEVEGLSCEDALVKARALTKSVALDQARLVYLWLLTHCHGSAALPEVMLEAGSLFGHLLHRPREARLVYAEFLQRFPDHADAGTVTYHLARLEIDAGDYAAAVARLTALAQRYPNNWHDESAKFLATRAAEMLGAEKRSRRTFLGQVAQFVPNNFVSLLALLTALGPTVIQLASKARESAKSGVRSSWAMPAIIVGLTLLNYVINNVDSARQNRILMEKLDRLAGVGAQAEARQ